MCRRQLQQMSTLGGGRGVVLLTHGSTRTSVRSPSSTNNTISLGRTNVCRREHAQAQWQMNKSAVAAVVEQYANHYWSRAAATDERGCCCHELYRATGESYQKQYCVCPVCIVCTRFVGRRVDSSTCVGAVLYCNHRLHTGPLPRRWGLSLSARKSSALRAVRPLSHGAGAGADAGHKIYPVSCREQYTKRMDNRKLRLLYLLYLRRKDQINFD